MFHAAYRAVLRGPRFRGRHRIERFLRRRLAPRSVAVAGGVRMLLDAQEWTQIELMSGVAPEPRTAALIERLLAAGDTFVDVGAHVGWLALVGARAVGPSGTVVAVDPQPYNCDRLLANAEANGFATIVVVAAAIGEHDGPLRLPDQSASDKARLTLAGAGVNDRGTLFLTHVLTLPSLFRHLELGRVALLKVDVEGFELKLLRAARPVLGGVDNIVFESLPEHAGDLAAIGTILADAGFALGTVEGNPLDGRPVPENNVWAFRR